MELGAARLHSQGLNAARANAAAFFRSEQRNASGLAFFPIKFNICICIPSPDSYQPVLLSREIHLLLLACYPSAPSNSARFFFEYLGLAQGCLSLMCVRRRVVQMQGLIEDFAARRRQLHF